MIILCCKRKRKLKHQHRSISFRIFMMWFRSSFLCKRRQIVFFFFFLKTKLHFLLLTNSHKRLDFNHNTIQPTHKNTPKKRHQITVFRLNLSIYLLYFIYFFLCSLLLSKLIWICLNIARRANYLIFNKNKNSWPPPWMTQNIEEFKMHRKSIWSHFVVVFVVVCCEAGAIQSA